MSVLFTYRLLFAIGVDEIGEVVTCSTFASITLFVDAVSAFPTRYFCAIVRMRAAMVVEIDTGVIIVAGIAHA